jgi:hypothetical protein
MLSCQKFASQQVSFEDFTSLVQSQHFVSRTTSVLVAISAALSSTDYDVVATWVAMLAAVALELQEALQRAANIWK